jgi:hypothetical protein
MKEKGLASRILRPFKSGDLLQLASLPREVSWDRFHCPGYYDWQVASSSRIIKSPQSKMFLESVLGV